MAKSVFHDGDEGVELIIRDKKKQPREPRPARWPVHVVYGGAHIFRADTPAKLGAIALKTLDEYASNADEFASVFGIGRDIAADVLRRAKEKLLADPIEDYRIDFEDGYGFRPDDEEDGHAVAAAGELASAFLANSLPAMCGIRPKSFGPETYGRAVHTLKLFVAALLEKTGGDLPDNFVVTLPKVSNKKEVRDLCRVLKQIEKDHKIQKGSIGVELMIETPEAIIDAKGRCPLRSFVRAADGRCTSVHFGAYDYTASLGISAAYQHLRHDACNYARQTMIAALSPLGMRLSDSVTTSIPVAVHRSNHPSKTERHENETAIRRAWREHFDNVGFSIANGFYQSWDLHPNQLPARYAAVYSFFIRHQAAQAKRLSGFIEKATKANLTGNAFDDAASARGLVNFFERGVGCGAIDEGEINSMFGTSTAGLRQIFSGL